MDTEQIISHARARFHHAQAKRVLQEKYQAKMTFAHNGGMWQAGPELLSVLNCCAMDQEVVLKDLYDNPVKVNTKELRDLASQRWQESMNAWLIEYEELNKKR